MTYSKFTPIDITTVTEQQLAPIRSALEPCSPEVWSELADLFFLSLRDAETLRSIPDGDIADAVVALVYQTAFSYGGHNFYLPKGVRLSAEIRDNKIAKEFKGNNIFEIAKKYQMTDMRVRQILLEKGVLNRPKRPWSQ